MTNVNYGNAAPQAQAVIVALAMVMGLVHPRLTLGQDASSSSEGRNFSLQEGKGVPVCEAYLELLNQTKFDATPFCGRPEEGAVKGFEHLDGHYMKAEEILPLFTAVWEFMRFDDQHHIEKFFVPATPSTPAHWSTEATSEDDIAQALRNGWLAVWAYTTPIDINNDGSPLSVVTWQGYGATGTRVRCGDDYATHPWSDSYTNQRAFVLAPDGKAIDESKTRLIFGATAGTPRSPDPQLPNGPTFLGPHTFKPLADSIGVFKYEGRYYIETQARPSSVDDSLPPVQVLLRQHGNVSRVCSLRPESVPVPQD